MRRRDFLKLVGAAVVGGPLVATGKAPNRPSVRVTAGSIKQFRMMVAGAAGIRAGEMVYWPEKFDFGDSPLDITKPNTVTFGYADASWEKDNHG